MSNGLVKDRVKFFENFVNANKDASKKAKKSPKKTEQPCPLPEFELVELVEVVTQDKEKWVKGAGMPTTEITEHVERTDKDGEHFKQYINLKKDLETQNKKHPEYGREITFRARVKRKDNKTESLDGVRVTFKSKCAKAANRAAPDAAIWSDANANFTDNDQKEGFGSKGGGDTTSANTDDKGWTTPVTFYLSQYGGDQFEISAELDSSVKGASGAQPKKTKKYIVWRKFWYQLTYGKYKYDGINEYVPPPLQQAKDAYKEVFAEMVEAAAENPQKNVFEKTDLPEDLRKRTFLEEYQVKQGGSENKVAVIGAHNKIEFTKAAIYKKDKPKGTQPKANLIVCQYQCDPQSKWDPISKTHSIHVPTALGAFDLKQDCLVTFPGNEHRTGGPIVCKPTLWPNSDLVVTGEWFRTGGVVKGGDIKDDCIEIYKGRPSTLTVKVDLTKATKASALHPPPVPTDLAPVKIKLQVETASDYLGESFGDKQILCVYRPGADNTKPTTGNKQDFNNTVAHELGHMWNQTPRPAKKPKSLKDHPLQYVAHGGSGPHCRNNAQGGRAAGIGVYSQNARTTITSKHNATTYIVVDGNGFVQGHEVTVGGVVKTVKTQYSNGLEFEGPDFNAAVNAVVVQTFTGFDKGRTNTTITAAGANTKTHQVAKSEDFVVGEKVKVKGVDNVVEAKPDKTHLRFKNSITTAVNDKVVAQVDWNNAGQDYPAPVDGDCIMFHSFSKKCTNKFCKTCKPYLQLQDMKDF